MFNNNNIYHVPLGLSDGMPHNSNIPPASTIQCFYIPKKPVRYINDSQKHFLFNHQDQYGPSPFAISHTVWSTNVTGKMHLEGESAQQPPSSTIWKKLDSLSMCVCANKLRGNGWKNLFPLAEMMMMRLSLKHHDHRLRGFCHWYERVVLLTTGCHKARIPFPIGLAPLNHVHYISIERDHEIVLRDHLRHFSVVILFTTPKLKQGLW